MFRLFLIAFFTALSSAQEVKPAITEIGTDQLKIGKITLNQKTREISFGAGVNMNEGLIEFALVLTKGKVHEALFLTDISPTNLNIALKLLRYQESPELFEIIDKDYNRTGKFPKVPEKQKKAARLEIEVSWTEGENDEVKKSESLNNLILHAVTEKPMLPGPWLNTGSYLFEGKFRPETGGDLIAIYTAEPAMINYPGKDRTNDDVWLPNKKRLPSLDTAVTITIKPVQP